MQVNDFITAFNDYRASNYPPLELICVDESISRWNGLGGHWINIGLPLYVAINRKPENRAKTQDACDSKSKIMLHLKLVKGAREDNRIANANEDDGEESDKMII